MKNRLTVVLMLYQRHRRWTSIKTLLVKFVSFGIRQQNCCQSNEMNRALGQLCAHNYRLNWARRTSWGWWDDWDDTVLQTQDSKFEPWRSEAEHATSRSRRLLCCQSKVRTSKSGAEYLNNVYKMMSEKMLTVDLWDATYYNSIIIQSKNYSIARFTIPFHYE